MSLDKPTSFDIAELAGVSQPTVSRALRGDRTVSEATRKRIEAIGIKTFYAIVSDALTDPSLAALTRLDTPVMVVMDLRDDGWLAGPTENMLAFLTKIGLR